MSNYEKQTWDRLIRAGMTPEGAAGLMGNLYAESGLISTRVEILCRKRLEELGKHYTDATYTAFVDDGTITRDQFLHPLPGKQYGYGLAQWTTPERKARLYDLCKSKHVSIGDLSTQLDYLIDELQQYFPSVWATLTTVNDVRQATETVLKKFEMPSDCSAAVVNARNAHSVKYLTKYGGTAKEPAAKTGGKNTMTIPEAALKWALEIAADPSHGYSQQNRFGPDYDCSSLALSAYKQAGVPIDWNKCCYTGNMDYLANYGFRDVASSVNLNTGAGLQPGDILYYHISGTNGHTALYAGNGQIVHARGQSYGSPATGDQGTEIAVTPYSRSKWQHVMRYTEGGAAATPSAPAAKPTPAKPAQKRYAVTTTLPIIKRGHVGTASKIWQTIVGVNADGEFGPATDKATRAFQQAHGLEVDGEVGPQTWAAGFGGLS